ncbi:hypothetical protein [Ruegeria halocynthiae]|uniref:hypothetical protein n=1 Tax=Ruegeria halocynthiae TaxID=985054 RepID=UPI0005692F10|nr:hypothetical protein [Ruegeria halocynthiae]
MFNPGRSKPDDCQGQRCRAKHADAVASIGAISEDKTLGPVARLAKTGDVSGDRIVQVLDGFTRPWHWPD